MMEQKCFLHTRMTYVQSINDTTAGVWKFDYKGLIFIDLGIKINDICLYDVLLSQQLLSAIRQLSGKFTFQHDSSPKYKILLSQGSAATGWRCGEIFYNGFIANLSRNVPVKEFLKSVNIC